MRVLTALLLTSSSSLLLGACAGGGPPASPPLDLSSVELFLEPPPLATGSMRYVDALRTYDGPVRLEVESADLPIKVHFEDYALAEPFTVELVGDAPPVFGRGPGGAWIDIGEYFREGPRLRFDIERAWLDGRQATLDLSVDLEPKPKDAPADWLAPGTRLYYGLAFDDKPITKVVPMGLIVTMEGAAEEGGWAYSWEGDLDENTRTEVSGQTWQSGRREIAAAQAESGTRHVDRFEENVPAEVFDGATGLLVSRSTVRNLGSYGGAGFDDADLGGSGVLERAGEQEIDVQVDGGIWRLPAWVAAVRGGEGIYVIAKHPEAPLILSASRPGWKMRLMAVSRPPP